MRKVFVEARLSLIASFFLLLSLLSPVVQNTANAAPALVTCVNFQTGTERISHNGKCRFTQEAQANWHVNPSDSSVPAGESTKIILICSNKESSQVIYKIIRKKCARHQISTMYSRSGALPTKPSIAQAVSFGHDSASLSLARDPSVNPDAPIAFYTISSSKGNSQKIYYWRDLNLAITGLQAQTAYTFTVTATTADGTSQVSDFSSVVLTPAFVPPASATIAVPAFSLSALAETKTASTSISGYTISSTGGAIAIYSISPTAPTGVNFNTSTGLLSGTPTLAQSATTYTITATNASGSATRTFSLTVTAIVYTVGSTGPGGGKVFYVNNAGFVCGPSENLVCNYLEAAPTTGTNAWIDNSYVWSDATGSINSPHPNSIGLGYVNTLRMIAQSTTPGYAGTISRAYRGPNDLSDWYLPNKAELNQLHTERIAVGDLNLSGPIYWSSSEGTTPSTQAWEQHFNGGMQRSSLKSQTYLVRPIRAF